jgi:hypothetical protein
MIIVGSKALKYYFPNIQREIKDVDVIGTQSDINYLCNALQPEKVRNTEHITTLINIQNKFGIWDTNNVEILNADASQSLRRYIDYDTKSGNLGSGIRYASLEVIFSLKKSHIHFPIKFDKHIKDYCLLYDYLNGKDKLSDITKLNFKETESRVGKLRTPSLNKSTKEFFGQSNGYVETLFIHDDIHRVMAHYDKPLYERMQKDLSLAKCEKDMWETFTFEEKCKCVLEEAYVIALERKILPSIFGGKAWVNSEEALNWSLMRVCTTLCSGWFRDFATNNYLKIKEYINQNYVDKFLEAYQNGQINKTQS